MKTFYVIRKHCIQIYWFSQIKLWSNQDLSFLDLSKEQSEKKQPHHQTPQELLARYLQTDLI